MPIIACGINHKTAPIELREKAIFFEEKTPLYLADLANNESIKEAVLLSTCNRTELYCFTKDVTQALAWFCRQHDAPLETYLYCHEDQAAIEHIISVACGLDSMVLGEPEILGQMKHAFSESVAAGSVDSLFHRLFQQVFAVAKEVRSTTTIGACPVSVASTAINLVKQIHPTPLQDATVLLVGAGETAQLVLKHLMAHSPKKIIIANRSAANAMPDFAEKITLSALPNVLNTVDIILTATASITPIINKNSFKNEPTKKITIVDLAVPRDVDIDVASLPNIQLFSIDDLKNKIQHNLLGREHAAEKAREVVKKKTQEFMLWLQTFDKAALTIRAYRKQIEELCNTELKKALRQLNQSDCNSAHAQEVLTHFAYALTNKLLHIPSVQLRQAGVEGRLELLDLVQQLFALPTLQTEIS